MVTTLSSNVEELKDEVKLLQRQQQRLLLTVGKQNSAETDPARFELNTIPVTTLEELESLEDKLQSTSYFHALVSMKFNLFFYINVN